VHGDSVPEAGDPSSPSGTCGRADRFQWARSPSLSDPSTRCANGFWQLSWLRQNALSPRDALSALLETFGRSRGRGRRLAPNARAKFGAGLRLRRYVRPRACAPAVQAVPLPTQPTTEVCDARIRCRKLVHFRLDPIAWTGLPLGQYDALIAIEARKGAEVVTYEIRIAPDKARK
jgi:hypothetical protein